MNQQKKTLELSKSSTRKMLSPAQPSIGYRGLSRLFSYVLIGLLALLVVSCASLKTRSCREKPILQEQQTETARADSASQSIQQRIASETTTRLWMQPVAADTALMEIQLDALASLPLGASYQQKHGRANVKAYVKKADPDGGDKGTIAPTLVIEASCDSLQQLYIEQTIRADSLQRQADYMSRQMQEAYLNTIKTPTKQHSNAIAWILAVVALTAILLASSKGKH